VLGLNLVPLEHALVRIDCVSICGVFVLSIDYRLVVTSTRSLSAQVQRVLNVQAVDLCHAHWLHLRGVSRRGTGRRTVGRLDRSLFDRNGRR
jgi:hypothetical protein